MHNQITMFNPNNQRKHKIIWMVISILAALGMIVSLALPLFA